MATALDAELLRELPAPGALLARVRASRRAADLAQFDVLACAAQWADIHPLVSPEAEGALGDGNLPELS
jgi:hypothetical protein